MKKITAICSAVLLLSTASAGTAFSQERGHDKGQEYGRGQEQGRGGYQDQGQERGRGQDQGRGGYQDHGDRGNDHSRNDRVDYGNRWDHNHDGHGENGYGPERGAGPRHDLHRGERLSQEYRSRQYVVDDWRGHRLSPPPRGYHWVQAGSDYVLVAVATGIITNILLNR